MPKGSKICQLRQPLVCLYSRQSYQIQKHYLPVSSSCHEHFMKRKLSMKILFNVVNPSGVCRLFEIVLKNELSVEHFSMLYQAQLDIETNNKLAASLFLQLDLVLKLYFRHKTKVDHCPG